MVTTRLLCSVNRIDHDIAKMQIESDTGMAILIDLSVLPLFATKLILRQLNQMTSGSHVGVSIIDVHPIAQLSLHQQKGSESIDMLISSNITRKYDKQSDQGQDDYQH